MTTAGRALGSALASSTLGILPAYLYSSLSVLMGADLAGDEAATGAAVSFFFLVGGIAVLPGGRVAQHAGPRLALSLGAAFTGVALVGIAFVASSWLAILGFLALAGVANGVTQPAANLALVRGVAPDRHGLAFGVKQSASPLATLLIGLALPTFAVAAGWPWAFAVWALLIPLAACYPARVRPWSDVHPHPPQRPVVSPHALAVAAGLASAAGTCVAAFIVPSAVSGGVSVGTAGALLFAGSLAGVLMRPAIGWFADQGRCDPFAMMAAMLAIGSVGFLALALEGQVAALVIGTVLAFAAGWGWPGLLFFGVAQRSLEDVARATSVPQAGAMLGAALGPLGFGLLASGASYGAAWIMTSIVAAAAAAIVTAMMWAAAR